MTAQDIMPLLSSIQYLEDVIRTRLALHFGKKSRYKDLAQIPVPSLNGVQTPFTRFVANEQLSRDELVVLLMAIVPHIQASFFDSLVSEVIPDAGDYPLLGGARGKQFRGFLPTGETVLFVLGGTDLMRRFSVQQLFDENHFFAKEQVLFLEDPKEEEPMMSGKLVLNQDLWICLH